MITFDYFIHQRRFLVSCISYRKTIFKENREQIQELMDKKQEQHLFILIDHLNILFKVPLI